MKKAILFLGSMFSIVYAKAEQILIAKINLAGFSQLNEDSLDELEKLTFQNKLKTKVSYDDLYLKFKESDATKSLIEELRAKGIVKDEKSSLGSNSIGACRN